MFANTPATALLLVGLLAPVSAAVHQIETLPATAFTRSTGAPTAQSITFPGAGGPAVLYVRNGTASGDNRVSSATVILNGAVVISPDKFNRQVAEITLPIAAKEVNSLEVTLASGPGGSITLQVVENVEADAAALVGPPGGSLEVTDSASPLVGLKVVLPPQALDSWKVIRAKALPAKPNLINPDTQDGIVTLAFSLLPDNLVTGGDLEIQIPYTDIDQDGIVDGTTMPARNGQVFFSTAEQLSAWFRVDATSDPTGRFAVVRTNHFSDWSMKYSRWKQGATVVYDIVDNIATAPYQQSTIENEIAGALKQWADALAPEHIITFKKKSSWTEIADLNIRTDDLCSGLWDKLNKNCSAAGITWPVKFDLWLPFLQHTFSINITLTTSHNTKWVHGPYSVFPPSGGVDESFEPFLRVFLHEAGHAMGLGDYSVVEGRGTPAVRVTNCNSVADGETANVMYYECVGLEHHLPLTELSDFDENEVRAHYGLSPRKKVLLLTRNNPDSTVDYLRSSLASAGIKFDEVPASQATEQKLKKRIIVAGFTAQPTEFAGAPAVAIAQAVSEGSPMIADAFGKFILSYAGVGSAHTGGYYPAVLDRYGYIKPIGQSPLFDGIPTWDPPTEPDVVSQYTNYLINRGSMQTAQYAPPAGSYDLIWYWAFGHTPGWHGLPTHSSYCQAWGGCRSDRTVTEGTFALMRHGQGKVLLGITGVGHVPGLHQYGPILGHVYVNFIKWMR